MAILIIFYIMQRLGIGKASYKYGLTYLSLM